MSEIEDILARVKSGSEKIITELETNNNAVQAKVAELEALTKDAVDKGTKIAESIESVLGIHVLPDGAEAPAEAAPAPEAAPQEQHVA